MTKRIDETLRKLAAAMPSGESSSPDEETLRKSGVARDLEGDPNCPFCHGIGFVRYDLPVGHPDFGKVHICVCRQAQVSQQVHRRLFALSRLEELSELTFDNFAPRGRVGLMPQQAESLQSAYNMARIFAQELKGWLLLQGGYGCGKTHLAAAIANFAVSLGVPTLFITVPDLLDSLRFSWDSSDTTFEERFEEIRTVTLLVLDDFGTQNTTPWAQEKLFQILNYRYINRLPTVVTTNLAFQDIEERIRSRLKDPELVTIQKLLAPDYRSPNQDLGQHELSSLTLLHDRTFATFDLRKGEGLNADDLKSLERAFEGARVFAESPHGWLVFTGTYGCGKTHLAAAIANYRNDLGFSTLFVVVPDLLDHLRSTFAPSSNISMDRRFDEVRTTQLLILDDLGTQSMTPWAREKLYQLFNYRYNAELPTVITTAAYKNEIDARLLSRMEDTRLCKTFPITVPSYRGFHDASPKRSPRRKKTS